MSKSEGAESEPKHQNKKKRSPTLEDFSSKKTEDCEEAKTSINEILNKGEPPAGSTAYSDAKHARATSNGGRKIMSGHNLSGEKLIPDSIFQEVLNIKQLTK